MARQILGRGYIFGRGYRSYQSYHGWSQEHKCYGSELGPSYRIIVQIIVAGVGMLVVSGGSWAIMITEVMPAPADGNEWVEIYNNESEAVSLRGWIIEDSNSRDTIECCRRFNEECSLSIAQGSMALIVDQDSTHPFINSEYVGQMFCVDDNSIGNGLSDTADRVVLSRGPEPDKIVLDRMDYGNAQTVRRNYSLERELSGGWMTSLDPGGTPLRPNDAWNMTRKYRGLVISEVMADPQGQDTLMHPGGEWVELYNGANREIDLRELHLIDASRGLLAIISSNTFGSGVIICAGCYSVVYRDGDIDFSLNNNNDSVVLMADDQIVFQMSYQDSVTGKSYSRTRVVEQDNNNSNRSTEDDYLYTYEWMNPTPGSPNVEDMRCDYGLSLETDSFIEQEEENSFTVVVDHLFGTTSRVNVTGWLSSEDDEVIEWYEPLADEVVEGGVEVLYSLGLPAGVYELNFSLSSECEDRRLSNNHAHQAIIVSDPDDLADDIGDFEYWDVVDIVPIEAKPGGVVKVRVVGDVEEVSRFWVWVEDGAGRLSDDLDFTVEAGPFDINLPIGIRERCGRGGESRIVLQGRGVRLQSEFRVIETECKESKSAGSTAKKTSSKTSEEVQEKKFQGIIAPSSIVSGSSNEISLVFNAKPGDYEIWGYLYRGSSCYSCGQKKLSSDARKFAVHSEVSGLMKVDVPLAIDQVEAGEYQIKVKVLRVGTKTPREFRVPVVVVGDTVIKNVNGSSLRIAGPEKKEENEESDEPDDDGRNKTEKGGEVTSTGRREVAEGEGYGGFVVYDDSMATSREVISIFMALSFGVLAIVLILRRRENKTRAD